MQQNYSLYTAQDQQTWQLLFERQMANLQDKACKTVLDSLAEMQPVLHGNHIPHFPDLNRVLLAKTGWCIEVVKGLIPADDFFVLLAERRFCSSTWLRKPEQLDYLEEPDMFHDIFGHIPLLMDPEYANFMQQIGEMGVRFSRNPEAVTMLEKLYWFTIEFGMVKEGNNRRIYGAGILSSFLESKEVMGNEVRIKPFTLEDVLFREFRKDELQGLYVEIDSMDMLYGVLDAVESAINGRQVRLAA